jgi:hypothetical protein
MARLQKHCLGEREVCRSAKEAPSKLLKIVSFYEFDVLGCFTVLDQYLKLKACLIRSLKISQRMIQ